MGVNPVLLALEASHENTEWELNGLLALEASDPASTSPLVHV